VFICDDTHGTRAQTAMMEGVERGGPFAVYTAHRESSPSQAQNMICSTLIDLKETTQTRTAPVAPLACHL
jgi:hypothetical protein